jgi:hypothetical protein
MKVHEVELLRTGIGLAEVACDIKTEGTMEAAVEVSLEVEGWSGKEKIIQGLSEVGILENAEAFLGPKHAWQGEVDDFRLIYTYGEQSNGRWTMHLKDPRAFK